MSAHPFEPKRSGSPEKCKAAERLSEKPKIHSYDKVGTPSDHILEKKFCCVPTPRTLTAQRNNCQIFQNAGIWAIATTLTFLSKPAILTTALARMSESCRTFTHTAARKLKSNVISLCISGGFLDDRGIHSGGFYYFSQESTLAAIMLKFIEEMFNFVRKWIPGGFPGENQFR